MTALLTENLPLLAGAPNGIKKLRELILELAVRGKLVPQDPSDEPASELLKRIAEEKMRLVAEGKIRKQKALAEIAEEDMPFELPAGWEWSQLGQISSDVQYGFTASANHQNEEPLLLRITDIQNDGVNWDTVPGCDISPAEIAGYELKDGDIVIARTGGTIGKSYLVSGLTRSAVFASYLIRIGRLDSIYPGFTKVFLGSQFYWKQLYANSMGTGQPNVNGTALKGLQIPVAPMAEQHRIVSKVDELMALCDRLEAQQADAESAHAQLVKALLDSLTQASDATARDGGNAGNAGAIFGQDFAANWQRLAEHFHTLFTTEPSIDALKQTLLQLAVMGKLVPQDSSDESAASLLQRKGIKSRPHILQGWAKTPLGYLGEILGGSTPSKANAEFWSGDIPWVSPKDMKRPVIHDSEDHISAKALAETSLKAVPPKSLLMVVRGMILVHSFPVALTAREVTINQDMKALVPPEEISDYLLMYLQASKAVMVGLADRSSHGTCKLISEKLWSHIVCLPPLPEQHRIVDKVDQLMALCDQLKTRLTQARQLNEQLASTLVEQAVA
ncbi:MAG: restriction endonuclease subunit S [Pseudomonas sp.]